MTDNAKKKPVHVRIETERKKRWQNEVERLSEYQSLADLIVASVEGELREKPASAESVDIDLGRVHNRLDGVEQVVREIDDTVDETYTLVRRDEMSDYTDLKTRIQELIPSGDREEILKREPETSAGDTTADELENMIETTGSISHLVRLLQQDGYSPIEIKGAIDQVSDEFRGIEATYAKLQEETDKRVYRVEN